MQKSALSTALAESNMHTILQILQTDGHLDETLTPAPLRSKLKTSQQSLRAARKAHLEQTLPITLLPSAVSTSPDIRVRNEIRQLVAAILAENIPLSPAPDTTTNVPDDDDLYDETSSLLAVAAGAASDELADIWNQVLPPDMSVSSAEQLPAAIDRLHAKRDCLVEETHRLDVSIVETRVAAKSALFDTLRSALEATELDTEERAEETSADDAAVDVLLARGAATRGKLRLQRADIAARLYSPESVYALRTISATVAQRTEDAEKELREHEKQLEEYRGLGREFEGIVAEFRKGELDLERKIWSRAELQAGGGG